MRRLAGVLCVLALTACGKDSDSKSAEGAGAPATATDVVGTWKLTGVKFEKATDAVVISGLAKFRFTTDGVMLFETEGYTLKSGNETRMSSCTSFQAGEYKVEDGTLISSGLMNADVSGQCGSAKMIYISDDESSTVQMLDGSLVFSTPFTYLNSAGTSVADKISMTLAKIEDANASLDGTWDLNKIFIASGCNSDPKKYEPNATPFNGSSSVTLAGTTYTEEEKDFGFGNDKCTATAKGTVTPAKLDFVMKQTEASADCIKEETDDGSTKVVEAGFVSPSGLLVSLGAYTYGASEACADGSFSSFVSIAKRR